MGTQALHSLKRRCPARAGGDARFVAYRARTSLLWPVPPGLYAALPAAARSALFFDWGVPDFSKRF